MYLYFVVFTLPEISIMGQMARSRARVNSKLPRVCVGLMLIFTSISIAHFLYTCLFVHGQQKQLFDVISC